MAMVGISFWDKYIYTYLYIYVWIKFTQTQKQPSYFDEDSYGPVTGFCRHQGAAGTFQLSNEQKPWLVR